MKDTPENEHDPSLWIDYLEGELTPSMKEDLDLLLAHCRESQQIVEGYQTTVNMVKACDDSAIPVEEEYYSQLEDKIMKNVMKDMVKSDLKKNSFRRTVKNKLKSYFSLA